MSYRRLGHAGFGHLVLGKGFTLANGFGWSIASRKIHKNEACSGNF